METMLAKGLKDIQALLKIVFRIVPIVAGLDKFTDLLTNWDNYLNPMILKVVPVTPHTFMMIVGVIEIIAGFIVFFKTEIGAYVVSAWLTAIAISLLLMGNYLDIAVRDLVMAISAFVLARLTLMLKHDTVH